MRRIVVVATALAVLIAAASAFAATGGVNTYTATLKFSPNKAKTALGYTQKYVANGTNGNRTAPLTDIKTVIYGVKSDGKDFPTCSAKKIAAAGSDTGCPKGALVATGNITATLGPAAAERWGQSPRGPVPRRPEPQAGARQGQARRGERSGQSPSARRWRRRMASSPARL